MLMTSFPFINPSWALQCPHIPFLYLISADKREEPWGRIHNERKERRLFLWTYSFSFFFLVCTKVLALKRHKKENEWKDVQRKALRCQSSLLSVGFLQDLVWPKKFIKEKAKQWSKETISSGNLFTNVGPELINGQPFLYDLILFSLLELSFLSLLFYNKRKKERNEWELQ